jgi:PAS domain S-box-containing protein
MAVSGGGERPGSSEGGVSRETDIASALRNSEERFARIFYASPEAIGVSQASDGCIVEVNPAFEATFGWSRSEAVGKTTIELGIWFDPAQREHTLNVLGEGDKLDNVELKGRRKDGTLLDGAVSVSKVELEGRPCFFFVFRDQTERLRAMRALKASEDRLRSLSEATFEGIAITDGGRIVDVNDQIAQMFRSTRARFIGNPVIDLVAPESVQLVREKMKDGLDEPYEHLCVRADGTIFPVEVRGKRAVIGGSAVRVTAIRDITRRKQDEVERERLIAELRARNAEMEQFAYTVSHDLKSPLVTINGFLGMLQRDLSDGNVERVQSDVQRIQSAASKMMRLLNDVLEVSRVGRVSRESERVPLRDVVMEALELVSGPIDARRARVIVAESMPAVHGDRVRLVQVLQNLIENAVKYMGDQADPVVEVGVRPDPTRVVCFVRDNGIGIKPVHAERVFGLFEKLDPKSEGTGVGLALVRRILEYHGGGISIESDGSSGTTFVVHFPLPEARFREGA